MATLASADLRLDPRLHESYGFCQDLHRRHGRTFYLATRMLPEWKRRHVHAIIGFIRQTDDIVNSIATWPPAARSARLYRWIDRFDAALNGVWVDDPVLPALLHTSGEFELDRTDFTAFLRSMAMDLTITSYDTYEDLLDYLAGSGAAIGSMMLPILGVRTGGPLAAREPARQLGLAFRLTNIIRDVRKDLGRGRIYLPLKDLAEHGVTPADLEAQVATAPIRALIAFEVGRARAHYTAALPGIQLLEARSQTCMRAAYQLYGGILDEVEHAGYDVFQRRATAGTRRRLLLLLSAGHVP